ncbi:MAG: methylated-DNA--[protein]-cysteine S-methyltransferase [Thermodesulfobacteriota bacterium]
MDDAIVCYAYQSGLVGGLALAVTDRGVRSITFTGQETRALQPPRHSIMESLISELDAYFRGTPIVFSTPLDPAFGTTFQRRVWDALIAIPYGQTRSYGQIAAEIGNPKAARAIGQANSVNRIPILIPCHRVIGRHGSLGGYSSGLGLKRTLLDLEGVDLGAASELKKG